MSRTHSVQDRDRGTVVTHGALAGLLAGLVLGATTVIGAPILSGSASMPFRFAASFLAGPAAFESDFPLAAAIAIGSVIHFSLAALYGIVFIGLLTLTYQLAARSWLLMLYGAAFGFAVWEVNFLAAVPIFFPFLIDRLDLAIQVWNGILSYALIYGPILGAYAALVRPGVVGDWREVGPPAGVFAPPGRPEPD